MTALKVLASLQALSFVVGISGMVCNVLPGFKFSKTMDITISAMYIVPLILGMIEFASGLVICGLWKGCEQWLN